VLTDHQVQALVGRRFPGGSRAVAHWENWLLTDCAGRPPMRDGLLHPVVLFHVPIDAVGTSIGELFAWCGGDGSPGSVTLLGYDWEYLGPLREDVPYRADGGIVDVVRERDEVGAAVHDDVTYRIELRDPADAPVARVTNRWRFRRSGRAPHADAPRRSDGVLLEPLTVRVDAAPMKTFAALVRDPYPIHWDPEAVRATGQGDRPVNQGPLNLAYIADLLMAWAGDDAIRRLTVGFHGRVYADDTVVAGAAVDDEIDLAGERVARCTVWLDRDGTRLVSGTALVRTPAGSTPTTAS
jgi:acyl dehydratase